MATAAAKGLKYQFFNPKLRESTYATGDAYDDEKTKASRNDWDILSM
jgi:hypothetical protein